MTTTTWNEYTEEAAAAEIAGETQGGLYVRLKVGDNLLRFLPPLQGNSPFCEVNEHCLPTAIGYYRFSCSGPNCVACALKRVLIAKLTPNEADLELADNIYVSRRIYSNVIDYADASVGPRLLNVPRKQFKMQFAGLRQNNGDFTNPLKGYKVNIVRTGTGKKDTTYGIYAKPPSRLENFDWIEHQHDIRKLTAPPSDEMVASRLGVNLKALRGSGSGDLLLPATTEPAPERARPKLQICEAEPIAELETDDELPF
jgi:hypothetical protein